MFEELSCKEYSKAEILQMKPLALAFVGDCVYELYVRNYLLTGKYRDVNELHRKSVFFVKAKAQAYILHALEEELGEEEHNVVRRGRNAHPHTVPKNADVVVENGVYYVKNPKEYKGCWNSFFDNDNPIYIEIGMGKGDFIIENAIKYPNVNFIGIEMYDSVMIRAVQKSNELELSNLKLVKMDATFIEEVFDKEIDLIYLNFSDPWPKDRHAKRRLTSPIFLDIYSKIFKDRNRIVMKTDNINLFNYSLDSLLEYGYDIVYKTNDLDCMNDDNIMTEYENRFYNMGVKINKLEGIKKK